MPVVRRTTYTIRFPMPDPTPAPASNPVPVPVPVARSWWADILTPAAIVFFALVMLYVARTPTSAPIPVHRPTPSPAPQPRPAPWPNPQPAPQPAPSPTITAPLALAARDYVRGLTQTFSDMASGIRSGKIRDKTGAVELTKARRQAFTDALDKVFADNCDANGNITNPAPLADALDQAARATGGN